MRYQTTADNCLMDQTTGIIWERFETAQEAAKAVCISNRIHQARQDGCLRPCSSPRYPTQGVAGYPPCFVCHVPSEAAIELHQFKAEFQQQVKEAA